jgi:hypothetical protein
VVVEAFDELARRSRLALHVLSPLEDHAERVLAAGALVIGEDFVGQQFDLLLGVFVLFDQGVNLPARVRGLLPDENHGGGGGQGGDGRDPIGDCEWGQGAPPLTGWWSLCWTGVACEAGRPIRRVAAGRPAPARRRGSSRVEGSSPDAAGILHPPAAAD